MNNCRRFSSPTSPSQSFNETKPNIPQVIITNVNCGTGVKAPPQFPGLKQFPLYESLLEPPLKNGKIPAYARKKRHPFFDTNFDCLMIGSILRVKSVYLSVFLHLFEAIFTHIVRF